MRGDVVAEMERQPLNVAKYAFRTGVEMVRIASIVSHCSAAVCGSSRFTSRLGNSELRGTSVITHVTLQLLNTLSEVIGCYQRLLLHNKV